VSDDYNVLSDEIVRLSGIWYELVNVDHPKDKDCHWSIETTYSYGDGPRFTVWHDGYVYKRVSKEYKTLRAALTGLRDELKRAIQHQKSWAIEYGNEDPYGGAKDVLAILERENL
jgi:hypothetical protein